MVVDLFAARYNDILARYPLAQAAAADLWPHLAGGAVQLEEFLRERLLNSPHEHQRAQFWSVPLYLQNLFRDASALYTAHADNYDRLVSALLRLDSVTFITLNYDTIFDQVLNKYHPLESLHEYVSSTKLSLIKLHGSVNWARPVVADEPTAALTDTVVCHRLARGEIQLAAEVAQMADISVGQDVADMRTRGNDYYFPALSAPIGAEDEIVCPPGHLEFLKNVLDQRHSGCGLDLLILGYSCLDTKVLDLFKESGNVIKSVVIVNGDKERGTDALTRLQDHLLAVAPHQGRDFVDVFDGGFTDFAKPDALDPLVERLSRPDSPA